LFLDGRLYSGATGGAGELGHVTVTPGGFICRCGNRGCLETVAGAHALTTALAHTHGPATTVVDIIGAAGQGDPGARRVLADAGRAIGSALTSICTVLDPALVVIGGEAGAAASPLLDAIRDTLADGITPLRKNPIPVVPGALGEQAEMLGAIALIAQTAG
jgi:predicted NBD/HSP70 family sugar kinase